ncbi:MAG: glutathione S-transferase family protein [SAR324 cluster bacterium]|nr:glutathione S-transferase family protein [SAR324 cluster bacterium]
MKLYDAPLSGNCYKIRLMLSLLGEKYEKITVNLAGGTRTDEFRKLNPRGQIPVLEDEELLLWDSQAILIYLARRYGGEQWLPTEAAAMAELMQWMAVAENELLYGLARARAVKLFKRPWNLAQCQEHGRAGLQVMNEHLAGRDWLCFQHPTAADIACYPYVALAPAGEIFLSDYPHVQTWMRQIQMLPGYINMEGITPVKS